MKPLRIALLTTAEGASPDGAALAEALCRLEHGCHCLTEGPDLVRALIRLKPDVVVPHLPGRRRAVERLQCLLDSLGFRYTGSEATACALAAHRALAREVLRYHNLPTPMGYTCALADGGLPSPEVRRQCHGDLGFPVTVRPGQMGLALPRHLGLELTDERPGLLPALPADAVLASGERALSEVLTASLPQVGEVLIERAQWGVRLTVAILGNRVLGIAPTASEDRLRAGALLRPTRRGNLETLALAAFQALGCAGHGCVELLAATDESAGNDVLLDIDPLPDLAPGAPLARQAGEVGLSYESLLSRLLEEALEGESPDIAGGVRFSPKSAAAARAPTTH